MPARPTPSPGWMPWFDADQVVKDDKTLKGYQDLPVYGYVSGPRSFSHMRSSASLSHIRVIVRYRALDRAACTSGFTGVLTLWDDAPIRRALHSRGRCDDEHRNAASTLGNRSL